MKMKKASSGVFEVSYPVKRGNRKQSDREIKSDFISTKNTDFIQPKPVKQQTKERAPYKYKTTFILPSVALSEHDKASQLRLSRDQLTLTGAEGGYRMVRATNGVHRGSYYWEIEILQLNFDNNELPQGHVRVGWSTRQGELQAPVGFDKYSYGYCDVHGSKIHNSQRNDKYGEKFSVGDVIGCFIDLHDMADNNNNNNKIIFFKNGIEQGVAFDNIPNGIYFPAVSLYMKAKVRVNFGPSFIIRPNNLGVTVIAISELQPMNSEDRKVHEQTILSIRESMRDNNNNNNNNNNKIETQ